jgi:hypothetical protein
MRPTRLRGAAAHQSTAGLGFRPTFRRSSSAQRSLRPEPDTPGVGCQLRFNPRHWPRPHDRAHYESRPLASMRVRRGSVGEEAPRPKFTWTTNGHVVERDPVERADRAAGPRRAMGSRAQAPRLTGPRGRPPGSAQPLAARDRLRSGELPAGCPTGAALSNRQHGDRARKFVPVLLRREPRLHEGPRLLRVFHTAGRTRRADGRTRRQGARAVARWWRA